MKLIVALVVGYAIGAKTAGRELDSVTRSLKTLCDTDEFSDVVAAVQAHMGATLRELAGILDGERRGPETSGDLVARVRNLVGPT
ncbi:MAG: hypothetical protein ACRDY1_06545 [Acidimicrobiales bacterium]